MLKSIGFRLEHGWHRQQPNVECESHRPRRRKLPRWPRRAPHEVSAAASLIPRLWSLVCHHPYHTTHTFEGRPKDLLPRKPFFSSLTQQPLSHTSSSTNENSATCDSRQPFATNLTLSIANQELCLRRRMLRKMLFRRPDATRPAVNKHRVRIARHVKVTTRRNPGR